MTENFVVLESGSKSALKGINPLSLRLNEVIVALDSARELMAETNELRPPQFLGSKQLR